MKKRPEILWVAVASLRWSDSKLFREHSPEELGALARSIRRVGGVCTTWW